MKIIMYALLILLCFFVIRYISFFARRCKVYFKLKRKCKEFEATLIGTHPLWFLGRRFGTSNDFYIEIHEKVFSVKLFSINSKRRALFFTENGNYFFRKYLVLIGGFGSRATFTSDSKPRQIPTYNFHNHFREEWYIKELIPVLLINPCFLDVRFQTTNLKSRSIDAGEILNDMMVMQLSDFIRQLERVNYEYTQFI